MLRYPAELTAWRRWHDLQHPVRHAFRTTRSALRGSPDTQVDLFLPTAEVHVLAAVEATHSSFHQAVVAPLRHLAVERTAVVSPVGWQAPPEFALHRRMTIALRDLARNIRPRAVLAAGHFTEIGAAAHTMAVALDLPFFVAQHGALTPFAPPLPRTAHLLAWSKEDAYFWSSGRRDITATSTGSQLMWQAGGSRLDATAQDTGTLTYLGQGHAAEMPRARLAHAALTTCREHGAIYRPHPSEHDVTSRAMLRAYERAGITVDTSNVPLVELASPIVSVFSTGVLEAAARGREAWVDFPRPPAWLGEFWERYDMHRLGTSPTPAPERPTVEPARRIADIVTEAAR